MIQRRHIALVTAAGVLALLALATFGQSMASAFSHDEHQFVTGGALVARGLLPYRDFPFHHLPNLILLYALPSLVTNYLLLTARLLSTLFAIFTLGLVFALVSRAWRRSSPSWALLGGVAAAGLVFASPLFEYTSGRAWNHDLSVLLTLASLAVLTESSRLSTLGSGAAGLLGGLAGGTRASFLPALAPLALYAAWKTLPGRRDALGRFAGYCGGAALGLAPSLGLGLLSPQGFLFGNYTYHRLGTTYARLTGVREAMNFGSKLVYLVSEVVFQPAHLILLAAALGLLVVGRLSGWRLRRPSEKVSISGAVALSLLLGSLAPTPSWYQYFFAPLPFVALAIGYFGSNLALAGAARGAVVATLLSAAAAMVALRGDLLTDLRAAADRGSWVPLQEHALADRLREEAGSGWVATLGPVPVLEAGLEIYPELSTGPFTWRVAPLLSASKQEQYGIEGPESFSAILEADPPAAILTGFEALNPGFEAWQIGGLEVPLAQYAAQRGYRPVELGSPFLEAPLTLWLP